MSIFTDRRTLRQIGGLRAYLRQVSWSLRWQIGWRRRVRRTLGDPERPPTAPARADANPLARPQNGPRGALRSSDDRRRGTAPRGVESPDTAQKQNKADHPASQGISQALKSHVDQRLGGAFFLQRDRRIEKLVSGAEQGTAKNRFSAPSQGRAGQAGSKKHTQGPNSNGSGEGSHRLGPTDRPRAAVQSNPTFATRRHPPLATTSTVPGSATGTCWPRAKVQRAIHSVISSPGRPRAGLSPHCPHRLAKLR